MIDQTKGDASVTASGAVRSQFLEMLVFAQEEHRGARVIIKSHPETDAGYRKGHFGPEDENDRITILTESVSPWHLFEGAVGVYTISSQMGFEAIYAGRKPRVFGQPFYAGWGLTIDENPVPKSVVAQAVPSNRYTVEPLAINRARRKNNNSFLPLPPKKRFDLFAPYQNRNGCDSYCLKKCHKPDCFASHNKREWIDKAGRFLH